MDFSYFYLIRDNYSKLKNFGAVVDERSKKRSRPRERERERGREGERERV